MADGGGNPFREGLTPEGLSRAQGQFSTARVVYAWMAVAQNPSHTLWYRREALRAVRRLVGDEAFYAREWPAPVPVWALPDLPRR